MKRNRLPCAITVLKELMKDIDKDNWVNEEAKRNVRSGVLLGIERLQREGFIEVTDEELNIMPLPVINEEQLELPLNG